MADIDTIDASMTLLPQYDTTSMGSVQLARKRERNVTMVLDFEALNRKKRAERSVLDAVREAARSSWSSFSLRSCVMRNVPIVKTFRGYWRAGHLLNDVLAGLTVGVMMIPQAMAFALVATLPPQVGLYMAFFSSIVYVCLGTGRHLSWNCVAVLAIMMGSLLDNYDSRIRQDLQQQLLKDANDPLKGLLSSNGLLFTLDNATTPSADSVLPNSDPTAFVKGAENIVHDKTEDLTAQTTATFSSGNGNVIIAPHPNWTDGASNSSLTSPSPTSTSERSLEDLVTDKKLELACAVTLLSGLITAALGKLGMGRVTAFMSDSLIISFTVGVSFHVLVGQAETALGLDLPTRSGIFKFFFISYDVITNIHHSNPATVITFLVCTVLIYGVKRFVNEKYVQKLKVPIPIELFVVVLATAINSFIKMNETFSVSVVKDIPVGFKQPQVPNVSVGLNYLYDGMIIILVAFTQTVALGKIMALKYNYRIDSNQEMFSLGIASVVCSFFSGFIPGASITCTVLQDSAGGKTQVASIFSSVLVLCVIMVFGPCFYYLPKAVLAAIVIVNIRSMFLKLLAVPALCRKSRADAIVWISTCIATVVLDTEIGLFVGIVVSAVGVLLRSRHSPVDVLGRVSAGDEDLWRSVTKYSNARELPLVKVIRINCDLYFVNDELIVDLITQKSGLDPSKVNKEQVLVVEEDLVKKDKPDQIPIIKNGTIVLSESNSNSIHIEIVPVLKKTADRKQVDFKPNGHTANGHKPGKSAGFKVTKERPKRPPFSVLVLEMSGVSFIDMMGIEALEMVIGEYDTIGIKVLLSCIKERCAQTLMKTGFLEKHWDRIFVTTDAAVKHV